MLRFWLLHLLLLAWSTEQVAAQTEDCDHNYLYVNAGNAEYTSDTQVHIACLDSGGCDSVIYVQAGCQGCFDPACSVLGERKRSFNIAADSITAVNESDFTSSFGISDGDLICSTSQLSVASRPDSANVNAAHEWIPASMAGTHFVYVGYRADNARFTIYAFEDTTVEITILGVDQEPVSISAFNTTRIGPFNAQDDHVTVIASNPVAIQVDEGLNDYHIVLPVTVGPIYGYDSQNPEGVIFDCTTLASTVGSSTISCADAADTTVTATTVNTEKFTISDNNALFYAGDAMVCSAPSGNCLIITNYGDQNGNEGTTWVHGAYFSSHFVVPFLSQQFTITSAGDVVTCTVEDATQSLAETLITAGTSSSVKNIYYDTNSFSAGTIISCDGNVAITASFNQDEYNLFGRLDESLWDISSSVFTCEPTHSPTTSPTTSEPTESPSASPSVSPTTSLPTDSPTRSPSSTPTASPTLSPVTRQPSLSPTFSPSLKPEATILGLPSGMFIIVVGGGAGGLIIFSLLVTFFLRRRRVRKRDEYSNTRFESNTLIKPEASVAVVNPSFNESRHRKGLVNPSFQQNPEPLQENVRSNQQGVGIESSMLKQNPQPLQDSAMGRIVNRKSLKGYHLESYTAQLNEMKSNRESKEAWDAVALYDFTAETEDELDMSETDVLKIISVNGEWAMAYNITSGKHGFVPLNHIQKKN